MEKMSDRQFRYCILYITKAEQQRVINILRENIDEDRGEVFYPCMEYYRRDAKKVMTKPIFPGYVFLYTDLNMKEVHDIVREHRVEINSRIRELALARELMSDKNFLYSKEDEDMMFVLSDVNSEETGFLDYLRKGNGLLTMSSGYETVEKYRDKNKREKVKKSYVVMEGPLKAFEKKIRKVDKHERRAYLEFEINGSWAQAGFNCLPKAHWYPDKDSRIVKLTNGVEVDLDELKKSIMTR